MRSRPTASICIAAALFCLPCSVARAEDQRAYRVGGLVFGDAYYIPSHHSEDGDGAAGAVIRRGYLTFDADFSERWLGRLRFELNQSGKFETYTFDTIVKDLYLGRKVGRHRVLLGRSPTPTFDLSESIWGLRYLARTPMDLQGVASRDDGLAAKGPLNASGTVGYRVMVGDGVEAGTGSGDGIKWMGALTFEPSPGWTVDFYADHEALRGPSDRTMFQLFAAHRTDALRWGFQYSNQGRQEDAPLELASAFVVRRLAARTSLVGRVDRLFAPSPKGNGISYLPFDPTARATLFIGGVEVRINQNFLVTPNTAVIAYDRRDDGTRARTDVHLRLTLFLDFE